MAVDAQTLEKIKAHPRYLALSRARVGFGWTLAAITLAIYITFVASKIVAPDYFPIPLGPDRVLTWGLVVCFVMFTIVPILTSFYVFVVGPRLDKDVLTIMEDVE